MFPYRSLPSVVALIFLIGCSGSETGSEGTRPEEVSVSRSQPELIPHRLTHPGYTRSLDGAMIQGQYTMEIQVGTPPRKFEVLMDTGSSNLILAGDSKLCPSCGEEPEARYSPQASSTSQKKDKSFSIQYDSGQLEATEYSDTVGLPGETGFSYTFGVMTKDAGVPNIMGLAYKILAQPKDAHPTPWFDALVSQTGIADQFSMLLCGSKKGGQIEFGGHSVEPTAYMEVVWPAWYVVRPDSLRVKGSATSLGSFKGVQTIVDSGTTELAVPRDIYNGIIKAVDEAATAAGLKLVSLEGGGHGIEGDSKYFSKLPTFQIVAGSNTFDIAPTSYLLPVEDDQSGVVYTVAIIPLEHAILGQVFMSNFYTVFDRESSPNRVGFAPVGSLCEGLASRR